MSPPSSGSVTHWLDQLPNSLAVQQLWEHYFGKLVALARRNLKGLPCRAADEEDVALSAFDSFFRAVEKGRFPKLEDRDDLWKVLVMLTLRKASTLRDYEKREKRDFRKVQNQSELESFYAKQTLSREPDPQFAAEVRENCKELLQKLPEDRFQLRTIAIKKMEGYTNEEISTSLNVALSTVELRLQRIRKLWLNEAV